MPETLPADALSTVARLKDRLSITATGFDALLLRLCAAASEYIKRECGVASFKETTYTREIYSFNYFENQKSQRQLFLKNVPVSAVSALEYNVGSLSTPSWNASSIGSTIWRNSFPTGQKMVAVTYTAGFKFDLANFGSATHTLPADLTDLCERIAIKWFKRRESEGKTSEAENGGNITWATGLNDEDKATLARYKRILFY